MDIKNDDVVTFQAGLRAIVQVGTGEGANLDQLVLGGAAVRSVGTSPGQLVEVGPDGKLPEALVPPVDNLPAAPPNGHVLTGEGGVWKAKAPAISLPIGIDDVTGLGTALTGISGVVRPDDFSGTVAEKSALAIAAAISAKAPLRIDQLATLDANVPAVTLGAGDVLEIIGAGGYQVLGSGITSPFTFVNGSPSPVAISSISATTHSFPGTGTVASDCHAITASGHSASIGDWIKVFSDDSIDGETLTTKRVGEYVPVADIVAGVIYTGGRLRGAYTTSPRLVVIPRSRFRWNGPRLIGAAGNTYGINFLTARGFIAPKVTAAMSWGAIGLDFQSCVQGFASLEIENMLNRVNSLSHPGYGLQDTSSHETTYVAAGAGSRHSYTTITPVATTGDAWWKYGRTYGAVVTGVADGTTAAAFDVHSGAERVTFKDVRGSGAVFGEEAPGTLVNLRGRGNGVEGGQATNTQHGVQFFAQAAGDCVDCYANDFNYEGPGDWFRIGDPGDSLRILGARAKGGVGRVRSNLRDVMASDCVLDMDGQTSYPEGADSGRAFIVLDTDADVTLRNIVVDLRGYTGTNYRFASWATGATGATLRIENCRVINAAGKFQTWANLNGTDGSLTMVGHYSDTTPSSGPYINGASATSISISSSSIGQITNGSSAPTARSIPVYRGDGTNTTDPVPEITVTLVPNRFLYLDEGESGEAALVQQTAATHLATLGGVSNSGTADSFLRYDENGDFTAATNAEAFLAAEGAAPYSSRKVLWAAGQLNFSISDGRSIITDPLTADGVVLPTCFAGLTEAMRPTRLTIPMDNVGHALTFSSGLDGISRINLPDTYPAGKHLHFDLFRQHGFPTVYYLGAGELIPGQPQLAGFGVSAVGGATVTDLKTPGGAALAIRAGDLILCFAFTGIASAQPTLPSGYTSLAATGATWGSEANTPSVRGAWKIATTDGEAVGTFTTAQQVHAYVFRKVGGSCSIGPVSYAKNTFGATTYAWPALTLTQPAIVVAWMGLQNADTGSLRAGISQLTSQRCSTSGVAPSFAYAGVSDLVSSWPSETLVTGSGGVGRRPFGQVAVY